MYLNANNLYGWAMSQKLPVNGFKWVNKFYKFDEGFIKNYDETVIRDVFLKLMWNIQKIYSTELHSMELHSGKLR